MPEVDRPGPEAGGTLVLHPDIKSGELRGASGLRSPEARLEEAVGLAAAIELDVVHAEVVRLTRLKPATLFGGGNVERIGEIVQSMKIGLVVVDAPLTPVQQRNLEKDWQAKVIDRTGLILEIFGARARTKEGTLQVELAALIFARSRLVRSWTHLERQRGGLGFVGGPGETQIETDRRLIGERITRLRKELAEVKRTRELHRASRRKVPYAIVALVGYTNAGKSTLFNTLTQAKVAAEDQLFATLDPTMRKLELPSGRSAILSDTVGFISDLPHELVEAFHATLEEVLEADIILHVRDISHPDSEAQRRDVLAVLSELGVGDINDDEAKGQDRPDPAPVLEVLNKIDRLSPEDKAATATRAERSNGTLLPVSAVSGEGTTHLMAELDRRLAAGGEQISVDLALTEGKRLAWLYDHGEVLERRDDDQGIHLSVRLDARNAARFRRGV